MYNSQLYVREGERTDWMNVWMNVWMNHWSMQRGIKEVLWTFWIFTLDQVLRRIIAGSESVYPAVHPARPCLRSNRSVAIPKTCIYCNGARIGQQGMPPGLDLSAESGLQQQQHHPLRLAAEEAMKHFQICNFHFIILVSIDDIKLSTIGWKVK